MAAETKASAHSPAGDANDREICGMIALMPLMQQ